MSDSTATARAAMATSNVYYLPALTPAPERASAPRLNGARRTWWRLRFALAGIRLAFRPVPTSLFAEEDTTTVLDGRAEVIERRRPSQPARVIDFDGARARLRPVPTV